MFAQVDGLEYYFDDSTVQRMELAVMNSLGWKLRSITPIAFAEKAINGLTYLTNHAKRMLSERVSELILGTFPGTIKFYLTQPLSHSVSVSVSVSPTSPFLFILLC